MPRPPDNPAGRLLSILERAVSLDQEWKQKSARESWAQVLEINPNDAPSVLRGIANVVNLPADITDAVKKLKGLDPKNLIGWIPKFLEPWSQMNLDVQFGGFMKTVDETMLSLLRICDDLLRNQAPEPIAPEEQLKQIHIDVVSLATEIAAADIEENLKEYLLHFLTIIEVAISDYRVKGFKSLKAGLEQCVGALRVNRGHRNDLETSIGKRVLSVLTVYALLVASVADSLQIPHEVAEYLPNASHNQKESAHLKHGNAGDHQSGDPSQQSLSASHN